MSRSFSRISRWTITLLVLLALVASVLPTPIAHAAGIRYAKVAATGTGTCGSWANACTLQTALTGATSGDEIWVGAGVHKPTTGSDRTATFQLKSGVSVYGGFAMTETLRSQRNITANVTVLSGDIDSNDITDSHGVVTSTNNLVGNNSYHVIVGSGVNNTAVLDGFTVTGGNANGASSPNNLGGGLYDSSGSPTLSNVTFSGNLAYLGGGMYNVNNSPMLSNVTFSGNSAAFGGGMYNTSSTPTLTNVVFSGNSAFTSGSGYGGGMYNYQSSSPLTNVAFNGNSAYGGGGMSNQGNSNSALTNVTFSGNSASSSGGGLYIVSSSPVLTNVTFISNSATSGGGMFNESNGNPTLTGVTFSGNSVSVSGGGLYNWNSSPTLANVTFSGNSAYDGGGMTNYVQGNPTLTNVTFSGNSVSYIGGGIHNYQSSPTLTNITLSGNSAYAGGGLWNEQGSNLAIRNTLLWGNTASYYAQAFNYTSNSTLVISDSVVQAGCPSGSSCPNLITADPQLGTLGNYTCPGGQCQGGGNTATVPLLPGSSAIDGTSTNCPASDQRGVTRSLPTCDIGAFESRGFTLSKTSGDNQSAGINATFAQPLVVSVTNAYTEPVNGGRITFAGPLSGAGTNPITSTAIITSGAATQPVMANDTAGSYSVTASAKGAAPNLTYNLTNIIITYTLNTITIGNGSGSIALDPVGGTYNAGTVVTVTATPNVGSTFIEWSGAASGNTNPVTITMNSNQSLTATLKLITYTLSTNTIGAGSGTIDLNPPGGVYDYGTIVTVTAIANVGSFFAGWQGAVSGSSNPVTMTTDNDQSITTTFNLITYTLSTNTIGNGTGAIGLNPPGGIYDYGTVVTATAIANVGSSFDGWQGAVNGSRNPVTVTLNSDQSITATFNLITYTLSTNMIGNGSGTLDLTPPGGVYDYGTIVTVTAAPLAGSRFAGWSGACTGTDTCVVTMTQDYAVTATFISTCEPISGVGFIFAPLTPRVGQNVTFTGSVISGTTPITYTWNWGDNTTVDNGANMMHTFPSTNTTQIYTVTLNVSNTCSGPLGVARPITVQPWRIYLPLIQK